MASAFNLTAQLNIAGPNNLRPVISSIRRELSTLNTNINLGIDARTARDVRAVTTSLAQLNSVLTQTAALSQQVSANLRNIQASATSAQSATNNLAQGLNNVNNNANNVNRNMGGAATQMELFGRQSAIAVRRFAAFASVTGVIYGLTRAFSSAFDEFVKFDREVVKLIQVTGQSRGALTAITDEVTRLSTSLGVSSNSLIEVTTTLAQAGLTANQTRTALEALAKASLAPSFDDLNATVEGSIALMRQFGISSSQLESALGSVNAVAAAFAVEAGDIITAIQRTGGVFAAASKGVSQGTDALNEFVAVFTSVRATTRESAETIATGLRTIFTRIQRGSTINFLNDLGIQLTDLEGKFIGPYRAIEQLSRGLRALDPRDLRFSQIVEELGGFRQIGKVIPLIQQFATAQEALKVAQRGSDSLTKNSIEAQLSLSNQLTKTREQFLAFVRSLGESQTFKVLTSLSLGLANSLISVGNAFKPILPYLAILGAIRGTQAAVQFGGGFLGAFRAGGGAGAAGQNLGNNITGGGGGGGAGNGARTAGVQANTTAILANTTGINALTGTINNLGGIIVNATNALARTIQQNRGGGPLGFARGGMVPGSGNRDTVPAMLTPGEFVIRKKAVETIGAQNLQNINKYASGGPVRASELPSAAIKKRVKSANSKEAKNNPELFKRGYYLTDSDQIIFDKNEYGLEADPNIDALEFEKLVSKKIGGRLVSGNAPVDIVGSKKGNIEVRNRIRSTKDKVLLDKFLRQNLEDNKPLISNSPNRDDLKFADPVSVVYNTGKLQRDRFKKLNIGGLVQKFLGGGTVEEISAAKGLSITDTILEQIKAMGGPDGVKGILKKNKGDRTLNSLLQAGNIKAGKNIEQAIKIVDEALSTKGVGDVAEQERLNKLTKVAVAGLVPIGYNKDFEWDLGTGKTVFAQVRGFSSVYQDAVKQMQEETSSAATRFAENLQYAQIFGGSDRLAFDFDETLVAGADILDANGKPDIPKYSDPQEVAKALQNGRLTRLGTKLKDLLQTDPNFAKSTRILTARPQSTANLLAQTLQRLGLPYAEEDITGVSKGLGTNIAESKAQNLAQTEKLIDDSLDNVRAAKASGKQAFLYQEPKPKPALDEIIGQGNIEGAVVEKALALLGANLPPIEQLESNRAIDFPTGLGKAAQFFGIDPNIPTEIKRTLNGIAFERARGEFGRFFSENLFAEGGEVRSTKNRRRGAYGQRGFVPLTDSEYAAFADKAYAEAGPYGGDGWDTVSGVPMPKALAEYAKKVNKYAFETGGAGLAIGKKLVKIPDNIEPDALEALKQDLIKQYDGWYAEVEEVMPFGKEILSQTPAGMARAARQQAAIRAEESNKIYTQAEDAIGSFKKTGQLSFDPSMDTYIRDNFPGYIKELEKDLSSATDPDDKNSIQRKLAKAQKALPDYMALMSGTAVPNQGRITGLSETLYALLDQYGNKDVSTNEIDNIMRALGSKLPDVKRFATGGSVEDTVPALLTPGEFVINKKAASRIGSQKLNQLNKADKIQGYNKGGAVGSIAQRFAAGGEVETNRLINQIRQFITVLEAQETSVKSPARQQTIVGLESVIASVSLGTSSLSDAATQVQNATVNLSKILVRSGNVEQGQGIKALSDTFASIRRVEDQKSQANNPAGSAQAQNTQAQATNAAQQAATNTTSTLTQVATAAKQTAGSFSLLNQVSPKLASQYKSISNFLGGTAGVIGTASTVIGSELPKLYATIDKFADTDFRLNATAAGIAGGIQQAGAQALTTSTSFRQAGFGSTTTAIAALASSVGGAVSGYLKSKEQKETENLRVSLAERDKKLEQLFQRIETAPNAQQRDDLVGQAYQELGQQLDALGSTYENTTENFSSKIARAAESISGAILQIAAMRLAFGRGMNTGGMVYASKGMLVNYQPKGTDTVPAMLSPGEFVVNAKSTKKNIGILNAINKSNGGIAYLARGTRNGPGFLSDYARNFSQFYNPYDNSQREGNDSTGAVLRGMGRVSMAVGALAGAVAGGITIAGGGAAAGAASATGATGQAAATGAAAAGTAGTAAGRSLFGRLGGLNGLLTAGVLGQTGYSFFTGSRPTDAQRERQARKVEQLREPSSALNRLSAQELRNISTDQLVQNVRRVDAADLKSRSQLESLTTSDSNTLVKATVKAAQSAGQDVEVAVKDLIVGAFQKNSSLALDEQEALIQLVQAREDEAAILYDRMNAGQQLSQEETKLAKAYETVVVGGRKALVLQDQQAQITERNNRVLIQANNAAENFNNAILTISSGLTKASSTFANSLNKIDTAVGSRLSGRSEFGALDTSNLDILSNVRAYTNEQIRSASRSATSAYGFQNVRVDSSLGGSLGDVMENASVAMRELEINLPRVLQNLQNIQGDEGVAPPPEQISQFLTGAGIPATVAKEIAQQISDAASKATAGGKTVSYADLAKDVPAFLKTTEIFKQVNELQINIIKQTNDALNAYRQKVKQAADALTEAAKLSGDFARSRAEFKVQLNEAVGRTVSVAQRNAAVDQETLGLTTVRDENNNVVQQGTIDINEIIRRRDEAEKKKLQLEQQTANADVTRQTQLANATKTQIQIINQSNEAIRKFATDTSKASNVLNAIGERRQVLEARQSGFLDVLSNLDNPDFLTDMVRRGQAVSNIRSGNANNRDLMLAARNFRQDTALMDPETRQRYTQQFSGVAASYMRQQGVDENTIKMMLDSFKPENDPEIRRLKILAETIVEEQRIAQEKMVQDQIDGAKKISDLLPKAAEEFKAIVVAAGQAAAAALKGVQAPPPPQQRPPVGAVGRAKGGMIYAQGGQLINFQPKGTDTVPAMLTPGEYVINAKATSKHLPLLEAINSGSYQNGGLVYLAGGGKPNYNEILASRKEAYDAEMKRRREAFRASRPGVNYDKKSSGPVSLAGRKKYGNAVAEGVASVRQKKEDAKKASVMSGWEEAKKNNPDLSISDYAYEASLDPDETDILYNTVMAQQTEQNKQMVAAKTAAQQQESERKLAEESRRIRTESDAKSEAQRIADQKAKQEADVKTQASIAESDARVAAKVDEFDRTEGLTAFREKGDKATEEYKARKQQEAAAQIAQQEAMRAKEEERIRQENYNASRYTLLTDRSKKGKKLSREEDMELARLERERKIPFMRQQASVASHQQLQREKEQSLTEPQRQEYLAGRTKATEQGISQAKADSGLFGSRTIAGLTTASIYGAAGATDVTDKEIMAQPLTGAIAYGGELVMGEIAGLGLSVVGGSLATQIDKVDKARRLSFNNQWAAAVKQARQNKALERSIEAAEQAKNATAARAASKAAKREDATALKYLLEGADETTDAAATTSAKVVDKAVEVKPTVSSSDTGTTLLERLSPAERKALEAVKDTSEATGSTIGRTRYEIVEGIDNTATSAQMTQEMLRRQMSGDAVYYNKGGLIYASNGSLISGSANKDSVPAMLTPGEFVVNRHAAQQNLGLLKSINSNQIQGYNKGGLVNYLQQGGQTSSSMSSGGIGIDFSIFKDSVSSFDGIVARFETSVGSIPKLDFTALSSSLNVLSSSMSALTAPINIFNEAAKTFGNNLSNTASLIGALSKIPSTITITGRIDMPTNLTVTLDGQTSDIGPALKSEIIDAVARGLKQGNPEINVESLIDQR